MTPQVRRRDRDYEATLEGSAAGHLELERDGDVVTLTHTTVDPAFEGRGVAGALARFALDDIRAQGLQVRPECPYVRSWIGKHPEYQDLVAA